MIRWRALLVGNDPGCGCERVRSTIELVPAPVWPERVTLGTSRYQIVPGRLQARTEPLTGGQSMLGEAATIVYTQAYLEIGGL